MQLWVIPFVTIMLVVIYFLSVLIFISIFVKMQRRQINKEMQAEGREMNDDTKDMTIDVRLARAVRENPYLWVYFMPALYILHTIRSVLHTDNDDILF